MEKFVITPKVGQITTYPPPFDKMVDSAIVTLKLFIDMVVSTLSRLKAPSNLDMLLECTWTSMELAEREGESSEISVGPITMMLDELSVTLSPLVALAETLRIAVDVKFAVSMISVKFDKDEPPSVNEAGVAFVREITTFDKSCPEAATG